MPSSALLVMLLDVEEGPHGAYHLWGRTCNGQSVLLRVPDFAPYFFLHAPVPAGEQLSGQQQTQWLSEKLPVLNRVLNQRLPQDCRVTSLTQLTMRPIMYYRPSAPEGSACLRFELAVGQASARKAANYIVPLCKDAALTEPMGIRFPSYTEYEAEVKPLTRFLCDCALSGGCWLTVPGAKDPQCVGGWEAVSARDRVSTCDIEVTCSWRALRSLTPDATQLGDPAWRAQAMAHGDVQSHDFHTAMAGGILPLKVLTLDVALAPSDCAMRVAVPAKDPVIAIACELHTIHFGEATDTQQPTTSPTATHPQGSDSAVKAGAGGAKPAAHTQGPPQGSSKSKTVQRQGSSGTAKEPVVIDDSEGSDDSEDSISDSDADISDDNDDSGGSGGGGERLIAVPGRPGTGTRPATGRSKKAGPTQARGGRADTGQRVVFVLAGPAHGESDRVASGGGDGGGGLAAGTRVRVPVGDREGCGCAELVVCGSERELLMQWEGWVLQQDPDVFVTFQLRDTLGALAARAAAIRLDAPGRRGSAVQPAASARGLSKAAAAAAGGGLYLSRLRPDNTPPMSMKSVVMYSPNWVKNQQRMASTSNQESFKMLHMGGRLVFDVLRQILSLKSLATFSLVDCTQTILNETIEIISPGHLAQLWTQIRGIGTSQFTPTHGLVATAGTEGTAEAEGAVGKGGKEGGKDKGGATHTTPTKQRGQQPQPSASPPPRPTKKARGAAGASQQVPATPLVHGGQGSRQGGMQQMGGGSKAGAGAGGGSGKQGVTEPIAGSPLAAAARLARYCLRRTAAMRSLMSVLATLPEAFEMARVTGLSINEVQNKAQMVRTWSLLLRCARRARYIVGGQQPATQLTESPLLMHPIEHNTAGLYRQPVACLDFASLYPSLYRAHNLCYTTLVVPEDIATIGRDNVFVTPAGHAFLKANVRQGILPNILAALMSARSHTREALKATPAAKKATRAVLDARQKALKLCANALYGFTGAQASPLQCVPLADSCLALGAASCRRAIACVDELHREGALGEPGRGARVIYGQTDSVFVHFPSATAAQAVTLGKLVGRLVTERCFTAPMQLQFERVYCPYLLLHVNRYAGRAFESEAQALHNTPVGMLVKGVRSMWRQSAPFVQNVLQTVMTKIIMDENIPGAVSFVEEEVRRLLSGRVETWELIMTGGLWRLTGQQVAAAAASLGTAVDTPTGQAAGGGAGGAGGASGTSAGAGGGAGGSAAQGGGAEKVQGPHAALAVKLAQRDPGRPFLLGERIQYVLLAGARLQDDAAENPLVAAELGLPPHLELYWKNKLMGPLQEILDKVLPPSQLQALLSGPHTLVRVEQMSQANAKGNPEAAAAAAAVMTVGAAPAVVDMDSYTSSKSKGGQQQSGLGAFFKYTAKCLSCKQPVQQQQGGDALAPALCAACARIKGRLAEVTLAVMRDTSIHEEQLTSTTATCMGCHSGGALGKIVCANEECNVLYSRLGAARRLGAASVRQRRLDVGIDCDW